MYYFRNVLNIILQFFHKKTHKIIVNKKKSHMSTRLSNKIKYGIVLLGLLLTGFIGYSQAGTAVTMTLQNAVQTAPNIFEYDIMFTNTGTTTLALRGYSCGINHAAGLNSTGTITHSFVSRDPALSTIPVVSAGYTAATNHLRMTTVNATAGNEVLLTAGVPIRIATMRVTNTVSFPVDFSPAFALQTITAPGKTQCIATCIVTPPNSNYAINGIGNNPGAGTLQVLTGVVNISCFFLNPTGVFTASTASSTQIACFGQSTGTAQVSLTSTGSAAPSGTVGTYSVNGGTAIAYTGNPFTVSNLSVGSNTITISTSYGCVDTSVVVTTQPSAPLTSSFSATTCNPSYTLPWGAIVTSTGAYSNTYVTSIGCDSTVTGNITFNSPTINAPAAAIACNSYTWAVNANTYTATGSYVASFLNAVGCDSSITLNLIINNSTVNPPINAAACNSYTWTANGATYTTSGTYLATYQNVAGCDSNLTLNLTINTTTTSTATVSTSGTYIWLANGQSYAVSGIYTATLVNANGCDSIATLNLTITGGSFTLSVVENQSISCNGANDGSAQATATGAGTFTYNVDGGLFANTTGFFPGLTAGTHTICATDGTFTLCSTITFFEPAPLAIAFVVDSTVSCLGNDGQISAIVTGGTNNIAGYLTIWTNSNVPPDTINNQTTNNYALTISNLPAGVYNLLVEDDNGCTLSSSVNLALTPALTVTASNTSINCNGGTSVITASALGGTGIAVLTVNGSPIAASYPAGTYTVTAIDVKGCTATSVLSITQPAILVSAMTAVGCNSYTWSLNSTTYTLSGSYTATLISSTNCDSVVTLNLTINPSSSNSVATVSACNSYTWMVNGVTYTTSGVKTASFTNAAGCDSSFILNLTINTNQTVISSATASNTYTWAVNGQTYTISGVYTQTVLTASGCVNTNILNLTINSVAFQSYAVIDQTISCFGFADGSVRDSVVGGTGPYVYILDGGAVVNSTGFFTNIGPGSHTICALSGISISCDTFIMTEPAQLMQTFTIDSLVSCQGNDGMLSINITGGTNILQGYLTWWTNANGDTLNNILDDNFALSVDSLGVGTYTVYIEDDHGCFDTAIGFMLAAPPIVVTPTFTTIPCFGGFSAITPFATGGVPYDPLTYLVNGAPLLPSYPAGTYTITATDAKACTGTASITITAPTSPITNAVSAIACNSYTWIGNGVSYSLSGTYTATLLAANGCDSTVTLTLTINNSSVNTPVTVTACNSFTWLVNGVTYTASGSYSSSFTNAAGCDSSRTLNLTLNQSTINAPISATACNTYTWLANGLSYTTSGAYTATFLNAAGCDSSYTLNLTINASSVNATAIATACNSYNWSANGLTYTLSGTYTASFLNAAGCDSTRTLDLTVNNSSVNTPISLAACDTYVWAVNGLTYSVSGTYSASFLNAANCDSTVVIILTINSGTVSPPVSITACDTYSWASSGLTYTVSGTYAHTYLNATGCLSTETLNLTINNGTINTPVSQSACVTYTWPVNGVTYTTSGIYVFTYINTAGCNSSNTLNLTINTPSINTPTTASSCNTYTWSANGSTYTASGTYTATFLNTAGCDSSITLNLTVTSSSDLVNTTVGNASSVAGTECQALTQADGTTISFTDPACKMIATIQDAVGGNVLGNVNACAIVAGTVPVYNTQPYFARYYTISADNPGAATLTLYLTNDDFNDYNANAGTFPQISVPVSPVNGDLATLCISQVPQTVLPGAPGGLTTVHSVTATWNAAAARWEVTIPVSGFGGFYFHACNPNNVPLPATVTSFTGHKGNSMDILEWTTSAEQNNDYFNLEYGTDGINFTKLAKVDSKAIGGNSTVTINYTAENLQPAIGHNYYRLQQVDMDGQMSYESKVVDLIWAANGNTVTIYPNPTTDALNIDLFTNESVNTVVKILDMSGRTVKQVISKSNAGMNKMTISMSEVASGIYTVQIFENNKLTFVEKVRKND